MDLLRPTVKACTRRYSSKVRFGRGFSFEELNAVGLTPGFAKTVGIAVDHRRHGSSLMEEENIKRLNTYKANLVLFPRVEGKPKKGEINDSTEKLDTPQNTVSGVIALPLKKVRVGLASLPKKPENVYRKLRQARLNRRFEGQRQKKAKLAEDAKK